MIEEHLKALQESRTYKASTLEAASRWLTQFRVFCGDRCPSVLRTKDLEQWHKEFTWTPGPSGKLYSEGTVNQAVSVIRRFYRWSLAAGVLQSDPTKTLLTPKAKRIQSQSLELTPTQERQFLSMLNLDTPHGIRDRAVLGILIETRATCPACSRIDRAHLCFDTGALLTKGRTQKIHSLSDGLLADLHRYLREARPLFVNDISQALFLDRYGNRLSAGSIQQVVNRARALADA